MRRVVGETEYELTYKRVKNINLRVHRDGTVAVSAPFATDTAYIDSFVNSKCEFIKAVQSTFDGKIPVPEYHAAEAAVYSRLYGVLRNTYGRFSAYGFAMPKLKIRRMTSQWGNCRKERGLITLNRYLYAMPARYIEYVAAHELAHMVEANHSSRFYAVLDGVMPDWRKRERELKKYTLLKHN